MVSDGSNCSARAKSSCANLSVALLLSRAATRACNRATRLSTSSMAFCNCQYWPLACASRPRTAAVAASKSAFAVSTASSRSAAQPAGAGRSASERAGIGAASRARVTAAQAVNAVSWFTRWAISTVLISGVGVPGPWPCCPGRSLPEAQRLRTAASNPRALRVRTDQRQSDSTAIPPAAWH